MEDYPIFEVIAGSNPVTGGAIHAEVFNSECIAWMGMDYVLLSMEQKLEFQLLCEIR